MKLPRTVSGERLINVLEQFGYRVVRQKGSHVRMRCEGPPGHSITVPLHRSLKAGTLHALLAEVARARSIAVSSLADLI